MLTAEPEDQRVSINCGHRADIMVGEELFSDILKAVSSRIKQSVRDTNYQKVLVGKVAGLLDDQLHREELELSLTLPHEPGVHRMQLFVRLLLLRKKCATDINEPLQIASDIEQFRYRGSRLMLMWKLEDKLRELR
jgi:hypothetical protein